jgi:hypothetical protein
VNQTINAYNFEVIGNKREDPFKSDRKENGFPVKNVELLIGYWTCRGPLSGRNLVEHLAEKLRTTLRNVARMMVMQANIELFEPSFS